MVRARKTRDLKRRTPLWIYVTAGVSAVALVAMVVLFTARTVQADAGLPRAAITTLAANAAASPTPSSMAQAEAQTAPAVPKNGPTPEARQWKDKIHGIASWYGGVFNGRKTASGETYDMYAMTACHPTLPFGSMVRVVNRSNHRAVVVRITDRGDLIEEGRVIDLSYAAAQRLGMTLSGLARVDLQVLSVGNQQKQ
jgi:rare lipoprotein A